MGSKHRNEASKGNLLLDRERLKLHALFDSGRYAELESRARLLVERQPSLGFAWKILGACLKAQGKDALKALQSAADLLPQDYEAHYNLGNCLKDRGQLEGAVSSYSLALSLKQDFAEAHGNLGNALKGLRQLSDAAASYRRVITIDPCHALAHNNLGAVSRDLGRLEDAVTNYRRALHIRRNFADAHYNLGNALRDLGRLEDSVTSYHRALGIEPGDAETYRNLGNALKDLGTPDCALINYRRALKLIPDFAEALGNVLYLQNYLPDQPAEYLLSEARRYGNLIARRASPNCKWYGAPDPGRQLRVGLVSGDLRNHPVGYFVEGMLASVASGATGRLELYVYASDDKTDALGERIRTICPNWHSAFGLSDEFLARRIHSDRIDILIDLSGHTAHNRLPMFAWRPAPIQVSWLGYFATTGVAEIDYLLADPWTLPESQEILFTEEVWRLPETRLCFTPPDEDVPISPLPALTNGHITFGCFNDLSKMNDGVVALWARVLHAVSGSRLFLKSLQLQDASVRRGVLVRFAAHGITEERLILEGRSSRTQYLDSYNRVDVALDPFPFTGGTTSAESLWMGCPVLTLPGDRFVSRQGVSLLMNADLADWVATDPEDYVKRASMQTADVKRLAALRSVLRQKLLASPICDAPRFARHFEHALRRMWSKWCLQRNLRSSLPNQLGP